MSNDTTPFPNGPLADGREFPEVVNGWTRDIPWLDPWAGGVGDYARGPSLAVYYRKVLPDGKILAVEVTTYMEVRSDEYDAEEFPEAELFLTESLFFHSADNAEDFENQWFAVEDYDYNPCEFPYSPFPTLHNGEVTDEDAWRMIRSADDDQREYLFWDGEPIHG